MAVKDQTAPDTRLVQLLVSAVAQLSRNEKISGLFTTKAKANTAEFRRLPDFMVKNAAFQLTDRPVALIAKHPHFTFNQFFNWLNSPASDGGNQVFHLAKNGAKPLTEQPTDSPRELATKASANRNLGYLVKEVEKQHERVALVERYFLAAKKEYKQSFGTGQEHEAYQNFSSEASNLARRFDELSLSVMFFMRNRNEIAKLGFDVSGYDRQINKIIMAVGDKPISVASPKSN